MEYLNKQFCPVCREAIIEELHSRVPVIAEYEPSDKTVTMDEEEITFNISRYYKGLSPNKVNFEWLLNGKVLEGETESQLVLRYDAFDPTKTSNTVRVKADEVNPYVKDPKHANKHTSSVIWRVKLSDEIVGVEAFTYDDFSVEAVSGGLRLKSEKPHPLTIYNLQGHKVAHVNVCGAEMINLPAGIYIVDGKKMLVDK